MSTVKIEIVEGDPIVVRIVGDVDLACEGEITTQLAELATPGRNVVVDAADIEFIDSTGLRILMVASRHLQEIGGTLSIRSPSAALTRLLGVTGLDEVLPTVSGAGDVGRGQDSGPGAPSDR